ncbi:VPS41-like protein [Mya arenaria]|uniref:VPS41-like protein n=1 Tax=Mya arenaria TaxID=6604 RepID=A0ABY7D9E7_MYAAR|nr:VPS41-like protein [Mya arenaria]
MATSHGTGSDSVPESQTDQEPKLRYDRVSNDLKKILEKDCASCMAVHAKHTCTVNQISVDDNGDYIASCSDDGKVRITGLYESDHDQIVNFDRPVKSVALDPNFNNHRTLLIGWADTVKVCLVKERKEQDVRDLPPKYVEIIAMFNTPEYMVCGIASLDSNLVLLTYDKPTQPETVQSISSRPNLRIVDPHLNYYEEVSNDALTIRGYQNYRCNDYHLVVARPRDQDDHVAWLLEHEEFEQALEAASLFSKELKKHTYYVFGKNKDYWEAEAYVFAKLGQLKSLAPFLPRSDPQLSPAIYEMVLNDFLQTDAKVFLQLIKEWPHTLYQVQTIISALIDRMDRDRNNRALLQALAELHGFKKEFDKALAIYIKLKHPDVFKLINRHSLYEAVSDRIVQLMEFDKDNAVKMLIDNIGKIPLVTPYSGNMVKLYAEFNQAKLLPFLRSSIPYPLDMALKVVEERSLRPEQVFLLGRMGNIKQALQLITDELRDVDQAIEFCKEHNDQELPAWRYPAYISLREGCKKILVADSYGLMNRLVKTQKKAISVETSHVCQLCQERILVTDTHRASDITVITVQFALHNGVVLAVEECLRSDLDIP